MNQWLDNGRYLWCLNSDAPLMTSAVHTFFEVEIVNAARGRLRKTLEGHFVEDREKH